jgi:hypothetical protein
MSTGNKFNQYIQNQSETFNINMLSCKNVSDNFFSCMKLCMCFWVLNMLFNTTNRHKPITYYKTTNYQCVLFKVQLQELAFWTKWEDQMEEGYDLMYNRGMPKCGKCQNWFMIHFHRQNYHTQHEVYPLIYYHVMHHILGDITATST